VHLVEVMEVMMMVRLDRVMLRLDRVMVRLDRVVVRLDRVMVRFDVGTRPSVGVVHLLKRATDWLHVSECIEQESNSS
jgi:hypothetical protein